VRLAIVKMLVDKGEECTCASFKVPLAKSTMSHHFKVLREAGILTARVRGTEYGLSVRKDELDELFPGVVDAIIGSAKQQDLCDRDGEAAQQ